MTILLWQKSLPQVVRQIVQRDNGAWFDPEDLSTMFQDAAGTIPVTAVEQPVGKILDKSGNGNHATQSVTASRPVLSARYNLFTGTDTFSGWTTGRISIVSGLLTAKSTYTDVYLRYTTTQLINTKYSMSIEAKQGTTKWLRLRNLAVNNNVNGEAWFDLSSGVLGTVLGSVSASIVDVGGGYFRCSITGSTISKINANYVDYAPSDADNTRSVTVGKTLYIRNPILNIGDLFLPYQRVNTATDYDTDERYFPKYLKFDGIDDYLTLGDVFDIGINGVSISASVILFSSTKSPIAGKSWTAAAGGRYFLGAEPNVFLFASHDGTPPVSIAYRQSKGESVVLSAKLGPHGNRRLSLYKNANLLSTVNTSLTTASYDTTAPFWIGAYPNSTGTTPAYGYLEGSIYGLIITKSALTDAQRIKCERFLAQKSGVML